MKEFEPRAYGMVVGVRNAMTKDGELMFAEIMPATPLNLIHPARGRSWKEPHIRWWFEVCYLPKRIDKNLKTRVWVHHSELDGGAMTFKKCVEKAMDALSQIEDELIEEEKSK